MSSKEKLSLRVERLEQQITELSLQNKSLKQQIEKVKLENLGNVKNDLWFKYRSEVHKIFGRIYDVISKYHKIFWLMIVSFIISIFIIKFLYKSLTTFVFISGFPLTLYLFMRIYILYVLGNKIDNV